MNRERVSGIAMVLLAAAITGCRETAPPAKLPRPVTVRNAAVSTGHEDLRYSASIQPVEQVPLAFKVGGYVDEILKRPGGDGRSRNVQKGDFVNKGTVLARVHEADYKEQLNRALAARDEARAGLEKARGDMGRAEKLYASKSLTRTDYDAAKANLDASEARLSGAAAEAESASIRMRDCALVAPLDAMVMSRPIEVGDLAGSGTVGFVLADVSRVKAVFGVPDRLVASLRAGDHLSARTSALEKAFTGTITSIAPSADPQSRVFEIELSIANPDGALKPGMIATVVVGNTGSTGSATAFPSVPLEAVVRSEDDASGYSVFVVEGEGTAARARQRRVTLGDISSNRISVTSGLEPNATVIVGGATLVVDGEPVNVLP